MESPEETRKSIRKCDRCALDAVWCESPMWNPDEPALCQDHFDEYIEKMHQMARNGGKL